MTNSKLHALGTSSSQLARDYDLTSLCSTFHDESEHTITGSSDGESVEQLVAERLALSDGRQASVLHFGGVERDGVLRELESLLNKGSQFPNTATLFSEHFLSVCCADDCNVQSVSG